MIITIIQKVFRQRLILLVVLMAVMGSCSTDDEESNDSMKSVNQISTYQISNRVDPIILMTNWFYHQQGANGLIESSEQSNFVSLYDNALAAMVFMLNSDYRRAERIFDFFNDRITSELTMAPGGFHWFRYADGVPYDNRWVGDNAWLLIALNNYKALTNSTQYDNLINELDLWIRGLQQSDGSLISGYTENGDTISYVITEGVIDAFNAVNGYDAFHQDILSYLESERWDSSDKALVAWPNNLDYRYSLDNQSWAYMMFEDYPSSVLTFAAKKLLNAQVATINGELITGFDIDEDRDAIFVEGTAQIATAYSVAGMNNSSQKLISELDKLLIRSRNYRGTQGIPYTVNPNGTFIEDQPYWIGADTEIAASSSAWYIFAARGFNPFEVQRNKGIAQSDKFWLN